MNIREAKEYIEELEQLGSKPGLSRVVDLCTRLGNPQNDLKFIHVAGTNGKGSVSTYVSYILWKAGIKVGRFTSPAVVEYQERYWISGRNVSQAALCRNLEVVKSKVDEIIAEGGDVSTLFEVETALSFMIFKEAGCEIVVLECGMGGTEDSTNIIKTPLVSVITSVSLDHTAILGKSLDQIARQKTGIIKRGTHVVTYEQDSSVINVIKAKCSLEKVDLTIVGHDEIKNIKWGMKGSSFDYGKRKHLKISMSGVYQTENAAIAVAVIDALKKEKIKIEDSAIYAGLEETSWPGRFQVIGKKPLLIIDGAHNPDAAKRLSESIDYFLHNQEEAGKIIFIFGVLADKNYEEIAKIMSHHAAHIITVTPPNNARALPATELANTLTKYHSMVSAASSIIEALEMAYLLADEESAIVAFGSLSFLGELSVQASSRSIVLRKKGTKI